MKNLTDDELVTLYAEGRNEAFDELLRRYKDKLYSYIYLYVQDRDLADDIFQDTFIKVIVTIKQKRYNEKGRFFGFLVRIAHNLMIDNFRQEQNAQLISPTDAGYDIFNDEQLAYDSCEEEIARQQTLRDIRHLIKFLPDNQQEIIRMRYYLNMSFKEIADRQSISINTALGRVRYAILNMRRMAEEHDISLVS